jgi:nitrite reductase/ring-hydroxylating ferredoxin subunit
VSEGEPDWRPVKVAEGLAPGALVAAFVSGVRLVVGRNAAGLFALDGVCPHAGAILADGLLDGDLLICPLHAFAFEVASGRCVDDESCSVRRYPVRERDGVVEVGL